MTSKKGLTGCARYAAAADGGDDDDDHAAVTVTAGSEVGFMWILSLS
jgi:hypothetical protein